MAVLVAVLAGGCGDGSGGPASGTLPVAAGSTADEARRLLAEAGFPAGAGFPKLEVLYNDSETHKRIAAAIQEMWRKELGIEVSLRAEEWRVFLSSRNEGRYQIARGGFLGEYRDPHAFLSLFSADSGFNSTGWTSAAYERLLEEADRTRDPAARFAVLGRAERLLLDEAPVIPIYHGVSHNWLRPFVKGVYPNYRDMHPMQHVQLEGDGAPDDGVLKFWAGEEPGSLDPALSHDIRGLKTAMNLFEGLLNYDPRDASPVPGAAERWEVSDDGLTYTFHLRDARWSNGDPLTAHDFDYSWRRLIDPATAAHYRDRMYFVRNGRAVARGEMPVAELGIRAVDDRTFVVDLERAAPYFPQIICLNPFFPVHRATIERHGREWTRPKNLVGNGPFVLAEMKLQDKHVFVKNPRYWNAAEVRLERFEWLTGSSISTGFNLYDSGGCHWTFTAPTERMDALRARPDHMEAAYNLSYFYVFNVKVPPLDDARVRRALGLAIDREKLVRLVLRGGETAADRITPPLYPGYEVK